MSDEDFLNEIGFKSNNKLTVSDFVIAAATLLFCGGWLYIMVTLLRK